jgi:hypothetical protein
MYREVLRPMGTGQTPIIEWDDRKAVEDMDRYGVEVSMLSISEPGVHFGDDAKGAGARARLQRVRRVADAEVSQAASACLRFCRCPMSTARSRRSSTRSTR